MQYQNGHLEPCWALGPAGGGCNMWLHQRGRYKGQITPNHRHGPADEAMISRLEASYSSLGPSPWSPKWLERGLIPVAGVILHKKRKVLSSLVTQGSGIREGSSQITHNLGKRPWFWARQLPGARCGRPAITPLYDSVLKIKGDLWKEGDICWSQRCLHAGACV